MIKETRIWYCDACGKEIEGYIGSIDVIMFDDDGNAYSEGLDFCKQCMISFNKWKAGRKANSGKSRALAGLEGENGQKQ